MTSHNKHFNHVIKNKTKQRNGWKKENRGYIRLHLYSSILHMLAPITWSCSAQRSQASRQTVYLALSSFALFYPMIFHSILRIIQTNSYKNIKKYQKKYKMEWCLYLNLMRHTHGSVAGAIDFVRWTCDRCDGRLKQMDGRLLFCALCLWFELDGAIESKHQNIMWSNRTRRLEVEWVR